MMPPAIFSLLLLRPAIHDLRVGGDDLFSIAIFPCLPDSEENVFSVLTMVIHYLWPPSTDF